MAVSLSPTHEPRLGTHQVGMIAFLSTEAAFFGTLVMAFIFYLGESRKTPHSFNWIVTAVSTVCLLSSSATIHQALKGLERNQRGRFHGWLLFTILLGVVFLIGTGLEWADLIGKQGVTIATGLFGSTYFTLLGFHAAHVTIGLLLMSTILLVTLRTGVTAEGGTPVHMVGWYWHFVDAVWVVIFSVVYLAGG